MLTTFILFALERAHATPYGDVMPCQGMQTCSPALLPLKPGGPLQGA